MDQQTEEKIAAGIAAAIDDGFEWAIVEIMGHRRHAGKAREEEKFGAKMLRVDVPTLDADGKTIASWETHYYGGSSIFSFTPTDEKTVMRYAERKYATPAIPFRDHGADDDVEDGDFDEVDHDHPVDSSEPEEGEAD